jgi:NAD(P)H-hydrate epimerase
MNLHLKYYTASAVRELDRLAIEERHIPGFELMQRAGKAAFNALRARWPAARHLLVFAGTGNNGGDGFVIAALAVAAGLTAEVFIVGERNSIKGAALQASAYAQAQQVPLHDSTELPDLKAVPADTVIVDALLGTGLTGAVRAPFRQVIAAINNSGLPVLAVDIPSGLCSDTGAILGDCVKADLTVTFIGRKIGLVTGAGPQMCGGLVFDDLGVPPDLYSRVAAVP